MIFDDVLRAVGQMGDPRFRKVLLLGIGLTVALLAMATVAVTWLLGWLVPESVSLPFLGEITWLDTVASGFSILAMLVLSIVLMIPVASAFTSIFLDEVADAVEAVHYPHLPQAPRASFADGLRDSLSFLGVLIGANIAALIAYLILAPAAPLIFIALNGFLLGREYFQLVAMRRLGRDGARKARRQHIGAIWLTGAIMAVPLMVPILNLLVPILGAASFTHLYHRLEAAPSG